MGLRGKEVTSYAQDHSQKTAELSFKYSMVISRVTIFTLKLSWKQSLIKIIPTPKKQGSQDMSLKTILEPFGSQSPREWL